jgi:hypothetical protein
MKLAPDEFIRRLSPARAARWLPSHPSLRLHGQQLPRRQARPLSIGSRVSHRARRHARGRRRNVTSKQPLRMPGMRRRYTYHRHASARRRSASPERSAIPVRHIMSPASSKAALNLLRAAVADLFSGDGRAPARPRRSREARRASKAAANAARAIRPGPKSMSASPLARSDPGCSRRLADHRRATIPIDRRSSRRGSFNPASMRSALPRPKNRAADLTEASRFRDRV